MGIGKSICACGAFAMEGERMNHAAACDHFTTKSEIAAIVAAKLGLPIMPVTLTFASVFDEITPCPPDRHALTSGAPVSSLRVDRWTVTIRSVPGTDGLGSMIQADVLIWFAPDGSPIGCQSKTATFTRGSRLAVIAEVFAFLAIEAGFEKVELKKENS